MQARVAALPYRAPSGQILRLTLAMLSLTVATGAILGALDDRPLLGMLALCVVAQAVGGILVWAQARSAEASHLTGDEVVLVANNVAPVVFALMLGGPLFAVAAVNALSSGDAFVARLLVLIGVTNAGTGLLIRLFAVRPIEGVRPRDASVERRQKLIGVAIGVALAAGALVIGAMTSD